MQTSSNGCFSKTFHTILVYLPTIVLSSLILLIYFTYVFTYITFLINPSVPKMDVDKFIFFHTSSNKTAYSKGVALLVIVTFSLFMLAISMMRATFMNPGYFPSPLDFEYQIVLKNSKFKSERKKNGKNQNKNSESDKKLNISYYNESFKEGPMTQTEHITMKNDISRLIEHGNEEKDLKASAGLHDEMICAHTNLEVEEKSDDLFKVFEGVDVGKAILCGTCLRWKAERSHHCRMCGRCVLKMDHHCPWLANCIGFRNYKYFCLIHLYGVIATLTIALTYWEVIVNHNLNYDSNFWNILFYSFIYITNLSLFVFTIWLFYSNWKLVLQGLTVIENSDRERFPSKTSNIYNLGWYKNFTTVFGNNFLVWFIPFFANYTGNGIVFETNLIK